MSGALCGKCKNNYKRGGWHCWSGNKSLGYCHYNAEPHPLAKYWNYSYKMGKSFVWATTKNQNEGEQL